MSDKIEFIKSSVTKADWNEIVTRCQESDLVYLLSFKDVMAIAHKMLYNEEWNEEWQAFATNLLKTLRLRKTSEWQSDWRNDAFLGIACDITLRYDERYEAFKNAYERSDNRAPELAWQLARCVFTPGVPPISKREAICILEEKLPEYPFIEGVELLVKLYKDNGDFVKAASWHKQLQKIQSQKIHARLIEPEYLT